MNRTRTYLRWAIGLFFLYSGGGKARYPEEFVRAVNAFGFVPAGLVSIVVWTVIVAEIGMGSAMFVPRWSSAAARVLTVMLSLFTIVLFANYLSVDPVSCGCGPGLDAEPRSVWPFVRNAALLLLLFPLGWPRHLRDRHDPEPTASV